MHDLSFIIPFLFNLIYVSAILSVFHFDLPLLDIPHEAQKM